MILIIIVIGIIIKIRLQSIRSMFRGNKNGIEEVVTPYILKQYK